MADVNTTILLQRLQEKLDSLDGDARSPPSGGGGNLEARLAKLESDVGHILSDIKDVKTDLREIKRDAKDDFRLLLWTGGGAAAAILVVLAKGFGWF
jgi:hypothetical protein